MSADLYLGLDIGSSGARAILIDAAGEIVATAKSTLAAHGPDKRNPGTWLSAVTAALKGAMAGIEPARVKALAVDGTSGTMLALDARGDPLGPAMMYDDEAAPTGVMAIAESAPDESAAHGATSGLAKAMQLRALKPNRVLHQADWIASRFSGKFLSDANNALKTGYDPVADRWPEWMGELGFNVGLLPQVLAPGELAGTVTREAAASFGLAAGTLVVAGTTDGCASFLATGAAQVGDAVTALGTTLTLKLLSDRPIFAPKYGVYSHRLLGMWLAGGASNTGGGALLAYFSTEEIEALSSSLDPDQPTGLDFYPLLRPGERFPVADPDYPPRLEPRPPEPAKFLQGLFEGVGAVEAQGYARLVELGAPKLKTLRSVGGGARNPAWRRIRARLIQAPMLEPRSDEAAYGAALIARAGA
jgi:sugar (pentulose or hexulose) kinase